MREKYIFPSLFLSLLLNFTLLGLLQNFSIMKLDFLQSFSTGPKKDVLRIKIRELGRRGKDKQDILSLSDLGYSGNLVSQKPMRKKAKKLNLNQDSFVSSSSSNISLGGLDQFAVVNTGTEIKIKSGVKIDELNKHELVYYGFRSRSAQKYRNAVLNSFKQVRKLSLKEKEKLRNTKHQMLGNIKYDKEGNVVSIRILKWSESDNLQDLFVQSLKDIRSIPNPPKGILSEEGFEINYSLKVVL